MCLQIFYLVRPVQLNQDSLLSAVLIKVNRTMKPFFLLTDCPPKTCSTLFSSKKSIALARIVIKITSKSDHILMNHVFVETNRSSSVASNQKFCGSTCVSCTQWSCYSGKSMHWDTTNWACENSRDWIRTLCHVQNWPYWKHDHVGHSVRILS